MRQIYGITAFCIAFAGALAFDLHPWLRGGFGWRWPYNPAALSDIALLVGLVLIYSMGGLWLHKRAKRVVLWWSFFGSIALTLGVVALEQQPIGYSLFTRTASMVATGPHSAAATLDFTDLGILRGWEQLIYDYDPANETVSRHVLLAPPGLPIVFDMLNAVLSRFPNVAAGLQRPLVAYQCWNYTLLNYSPAEWASAWFGMLTPLWAALTVFPLWGLARRLNVSPSFTVLLWGLVPASASFAGSWNTVYPLLGTLAFLLFHIGLTRGAGWLFAGGVVFGILTFLNFAPVPLALVFGFYSLIYYGLNERQQKPLIRPIIIGLIFGLGVFSVWGIWILMGGADPISLIQASFSIHLDLDRAYIPWLLLHTYDWALFAGLPLVLISLLRARQPQQNGGDVALAVWLALVVLVLSGTARGETARVWTIFTPFILLGAANITQLTRYTQTAILTATAVLFLALTTTWDVFDAIDMKPLPQTPVQLATPTTTNATFDEQFTLLAWGSETDETAITVNLMWQSHKQMVIPYWFSALAVNPDGRAYEATIWQGGQTNYPTTCWHPGEIIYDQITLPLPEDAKTGDYWLSLAVFADEISPEDRLLVTLADGSSDTQVGLGPIAVE